MRDTLESWLVTLTRRTRALRSPVPTVCVGGSTLGGTGKTPLAIAVARHLASGGARVALVGHAYRARPERARLVRPTDDVACVGDEALVCARALDGVAEVVVAPRRQAAIDLAATRADVLVVDGVLQLRPRATLSILTVPNDTPAPRRLAAVADVVTRVTTTTECAVPWELLRRERIGLLTCLARPARLVDALATHGVTPVTHLAFRDHGPHDPEDITRALDTAPPVDRWLLTEKCATHLPWPLRPSAPRPLPLTLLTLTSPIPRPTLSRLGSFPRFSRETAELAGT